MKYFYSIILNLIFFTIGLTQYNVAVLDLNGTGISKEELLAISDKLRYELFNTGKFSVYERNRMDAILKEQKLQLSGITSEEKAIKIGKLLGVNYVVLGNIYKIDNIYSINIRLVNVQTGKIEKIVSQDCNNCSLNDVYLKSIKNVSLEFAGIKFENRQSFNNNYKKMAPFKTALLSFILPGSGLIYSKNYLMSAIYFVSSVGLYAGGGALASSPASEDLGHALMAVGGIIHITSIFHTVISTRKYNLSFSVNFKNKYYCLNLKYNLNIK